MASNSSQDSKNKYSDQENLTKNIFSESENLSYSFVRHRRSFAKVKPIIGMPNLIDIQKKSYAEFLQGHVPAESRLDAG
ncbi:MAG: hypothetical protein V4591_02810, partial [Bdellovibrionota bacterium]